MQITQLNLPATMIDLGVGQPDPTLLPLALIRQAADHRLRQGDPSLLQYGTESGNGYFRRELARFLSSGYGVAVDPDRLFITAGATSGLDLVCNRFTKPGDTVFVEEPTYFLALRLFADRGLNVVGLPTDQNGLVVEALQEKLAEIRPAFLYTVPTFHNPSGVTLTASRREHLVRLSEQYGFYVVADEVYHLLAYTTAPPPPMVSCDASGTVISLGSFSKILAPGLRLGWIQTAPDIIHRLTHSGLLLSGGGMNPFTSAVVQSAIELGLQQNHLSRLIRIYRQRSADLEAALHEHLSGSTTFNNPGGGFFYWLRLPNDIDATALRKEAKKRGVNFQPGINFSAAAGLRNYMRLCFVYYDSDRLREGVRRLATVIP
ncbi:MAG: PLP-dependent aminotransferase family protein [Desulfobacterales bacterium]